MPQLFLILEEGNTALLTRALGDIQTPRFASQGLLSTIASWCMESCGHELRVISSTNVRVVYRRFDNHLLFVLVTSNLLLQTQLLQLHLETLYDVLLLLLGSAALVLDTPSKISVLRSKLKAPDVQRAVDSLVADDTLVPCILLPVPQLVGLPLRDKAAMQGALAKIVTTLGCQQAAVISEGYYLSVTHGWSTLLSAREQLLVQHLATQSANHHPDGLPPEMLLHLAKRHYQAPLRLRLLRLEETVLLAVLFESGGPPPPPLQDYEDKLRSHLLAVSHTLERPLWLSPPVPQFSTITFDLALVVVHSPPSAILLWGHGGGAAVQQGFNPLVSPSLRKQIVSSTSPITARLSHRPPSVQREDSQTAGGDGLQLFFRSTLDALVSFVLQTWPQMPAVLQAALQDRSAAATGAASGGGGGNGGVARVLSSPESPPKQPTAAAATTTASSPQRLDHHHLQQAVHGQHQRLLQSQQRVLHSAPPAGAAQSTSLSPPLPQSASRGASPASRLGLSAIRRISSSALGGSVPGAARLQALLFSRSSSTNAGGSVLAPSRGADRLTGAAAEPSGVGVGLFGQEGEEDGEEEPAELADVPYEEVHAIIEGTRLLALLDRSSRAGTAAVGLSVGAGGSVGIAQDVIDVFVAFPKRVGRVAALEAANTLRATYLMAYHDDD